MFMIWLIVARRQTSRYPGIYPTRFVRFSIRLSWVPRPVSELNRRPVLPNLANELDLDMSTMNISLPDSLKDFVDQQVNERGYGTSSEYVRELIRRETKIGWSCALEGAASAPTKPDDDAYFESLRRKAKSVKPGSRRWGQRQSFHVSAPSRTSMGRSTTIDRERARRRLWFYRR
jgi:antitoxin ParD1/3/4